MARQDIETTTAVMGANALPLGLSGLAVTVALFGAWNAGFLHSGSLVFVGMALMYGGLVQLIAGILEYRNHDTLGLTIFGSFGAFWLGLGLLFSYDALGHLSPAWFTGSGIIWFWFCWAIVATYMWLASLRTNGAIALTLVLWAAMFWCLWLGQLAGNGLGSGWTDAAGWLGFATAIGAGYTAFAEMLNNTFGRIVLPEFSPSGMHPTMH
jgi:succinate-acetate transporter protein